MMAEEEIPKDMEKEVQVQPKEELEEVNLGVDLRPPKTIFINSQLSAKEKEQLVEHLCLYDAFWP